MGKCKDCIYFKAEKGGNYCTFLKGYKIDVTPEMICGNFENEFPIIKKINDTDKFTYISKSKRLKDVVEVRTNGIVLWCNSNLTDNFELKENQIYKITIEKT